MVPSTTSAKLKAHDFITVREAAKLTGMSPSSVRRVIYPILEKEKHPDRQLIEPNIRTAKELRLAGQNFAWKVSKELLMREMNTEKKGRAKASSSSSDASPIIEILQRELEIKNRQIEQQNDVIKGLSERVREGNILMGSLQKHLSLPTTSAHPGARILSESEIADVPPSTGPTTIKRKGIFRTIFW